MVLIFFPSISGWSEVSRENEVAERQQGGDGTHYKSHQLKQVWEDIREEAFAEKEVQSSAPTCQTGHFPFSLLK